VDLRRVPRPSLRGANTWNGTALGTFGYENDSISRRTKRIDSRIDSGVTPSAFRYSLPLDVTGKIVRTGMGVAIVGCTA
jgi:hypothetical protein